MSRFRSRFAVGMLWASLAVGVAAPGCQQVAEFLLKFVVHVGTKVAASYVGKVVEEKLDQWFFNKNSSENQGGDVIATSGDGLTGRYNGAMEITVTGDGGRKSTVRLSSPQMVRDSTSSRWRLDPSVVRTARQRSAESFGN